MDYTAFDLMVDVGLISVLLIVGTFMRRHFAWFRKLLIPAPITAGLLALLLGPEVLGIMPFSGALGDYSTLLIAVVFAAMPYSMSFDSRDISKAKNMWSYSASMFLGQWGLFVLLGVFLFAPVFGTEDWFGMMLPVGFVGGFGTAAAVGGALDSIGIRKRLPWDLPPRPSAPWRPSWVASSSPTGASRPAARPRCPRSCRGNCALVRSPRSPNSPRLATPLPTPHPSIRWPCTWASSW